MPEFKRICFIGLFSLISGCTSYTSQDISLGLGLSPGMSKEEVLEIMGSPAKNDFDKGVEEWHYCKTGVSYFGGSPSDDFVAVFFDSGKVVAMRNYNVTLRDTGGATGDCSKFIRLGNFTEPNSVREIRVKYR
jgi:outer membrane protein assembly factor BamE (lipoprotein component of BamABCDE complex)